MDRTALLQALGGTDSVRHARRLFSLLGYAPDDVPAEDGTHVVARWRGFQVIASLSATPHDAARSLAKRLATGSRRALALACGPAELAIAAPRIGAPGITPLLVVPRTKPPALALQLLCELTPRQGDNGLAHALRVAEVLSAERAGERFFRRFRAALERMATSLPIQGGATDRRAAALIALTRVLFLYFVQAKGWLDGRPDYLRSLLDDALAKRRDFHRDVLHPLFFGTLNRPPGERSRRLRLGRIPYLNGGLFEPHPVERRLGAVRFPNDLWRETFDGVFERFRFCVREADEVTAVAPDMLGRVFERVMDDGERHATGTFYTPESVVRQMVDAAIETALAGTCGLDPDAAHRIVTGRVTHRLEARAARSALRRLRVLDPAAGSGAFLLGALERLTEMRAGLGPPLDAAARCRLRREILRNNLFGVDLSPIAVRLAELRLWLALVADDPTDDIAAITPLPNLDGILRQGDTLFDPVSAARALGTPAARVPREIAITVAEARAAMYQARGPERTRLERRLYAAERDLADRLIAHARDAAERESGELIALAVGRDLFGNRSGLSPVQRQRYRRLRRHRAELRRAQRALRDGTVPFFSFDVHLPDLARSGFAIVLGNPPWVRAERLPPATRRALASRFRWWRAPPSAGYRHLPDLSVAFLERSLELARPGGAVALLLPSKLASSGYGETARTQLVREATVTYLHRVPDRQASAFGATTYPLAVVVKKQAPSATHVVKLGFDGAQHIRQRALYSPGSWILVPDRTRDAMQRFLEAGTPLARIAPASLGVKTGADRLFVGTTCASNGPTVVVRLDGAEYQIETSLLRPALHGRDVKPFRVGSTHVVIWAYQNGAPLESLPPNAAAYFAARTTRLKQRADDAGGPPWTVFRLRAGLAGHRVVWPDIALHPSAVALEETDLAAAVPLNTCYVTHTPDRATALTVAMILNTTWARAIALATADEARGGYRRINARVAGQMPVPAGPTRSALAAFGAAAHRNRHADQDQLDDAVGDALGLPAASRDLLRRFVAHHG